MYMCMYNLCIYMNVYIYMTYIYAHIFMYKIQYICI